MFKTWFSIICCPWKVLETLRPLTTGEGQERQMLEPFLKRTVWETTRVNGILWDSAREKTEVLSPRVKQPCSSPGWGTALQEWPSRQPCSLTARLPQVWIGMQPLGCGKGFFPHSSMLVGLHLGAVFSFEHTRAKKTLLKWVQHCPEADWGLKHLPREQKLKGLGLFSLKETQPQEQPTAPQCLWGG